jgi:hypothetical protein
MHFEKEGPQNTEATLKLAAESARQTGTNTVIIATNTGDTPVKALSHFKGLKMVVVTHHAGFNQPWKCELTDDNRKKLEDAGASIFTGAHALSGIERSFRSEYRGLYPLELVAETLRLFGQGVKVCVEISLMAADAGLLTGNKVIAIGGTGSGADTAVILTPVHQKHFLNMRVHEIICKPQ